MLTLTSVLHDPEGRLLTLAQNNIGKLRYLFGSFIVVVSQQTHIALLHLLREKGIKLIIDSGNMPLAYKAALQAGALTKQDAVFLVDFDRLLVWADRHFEELSSLQEIQLVDYIIVGRTETALRSHPKIQMESEYLMNYYLSALYNLQETADFFGGAWIFSKEVAWYIVEEMKSENVGFYGEWIALALEKAQNIRILSCNGLEWETPYQFQKEIEQEGIESWKKIFLEDDNQKRLKIQYLILKAVLKRKDMKFKELF